MRSIEQIIHDNGGDNTPGMDTANLTGRAFPEGVEPLWTPMESDTDDAWYEARIGYFVEDTRADMGYGEDEDIPYEVFLSNRDWADDTDEAYDLGYIGDECG